MTNIIGDKGFTSYFYYMKDFMTFKYKRINLLMLLSLCLTILSAQSMITVKITDLRNNEGVISLELLDENKEIVKKVTNEIVDKKCIIVLDSLQNARYAIRFIHDENLNGEMDTNWLGIPKEGYGFSNDAYGFFGPKDFEEWLFELDGDLQMVFKVKY